LLRGLLTDAATDIAFYGFLLRLGHGNASDTPRILFFDLAATLVVNGCAKHIHTDLIGGINGSASIIIDAACGGAAAQGKRTQ